MSRPTTYAQALNTALRDALTEDENVLVLGEDVGQLGGVFRITDGLTRDFGEDRCFDTPLAEAGIAGFAVGLAMQGFRPVIEMQFDAFGYPAFEQVVSHVAKMRNRTRGRLTMPMVIRVPYAGGIGGVEHHCDSSEGYYVHTPGLHVVTPSTPADAYSLLREAIASPEPVVFLEPKKLYWAKEQVQLGVPGPGIGTAVVGSKSVINSGELSVTGGGLSSRAVVGATRVENAGMTSSSVGLLSGAGAASGPGRPGREDAR